MGLIALVLIVYLAAVSVGCMIVSAGYMIDGLLKLIDGLLKLAWDTVDQDLKLIRAVWSAAVRLFKLIRSK